MSELFAGVQDRGHETLSGYPIPQLELIDKFLQTTIANQHEILQV